MPIFAQYTSPSFVSLLFAFWSTISRPSGARTNCAMLVGRRWGNVPRSTIVCNKFSMAEVRLA